MDQITAFMFLTDLVAAGFTRGEAHELVTVWVDNVTAMGHLCE